MFCPETEMRAYSYTLIYPRQSNLSPRKIIFLSEYTRIIHTYYKTEEFIITILYEKQFKDYCGKATSEKNL